MPAAELQLLRPALELAWAVARTGEPKLVPGILRPLIKFAKLPDRALGTTARAVDEDEDFRARVGLGADELALGRAGYLFITRPEGWEDELAALTASALRVQSEENEEQEERSARKRLRAAEEGRQRAEEARAAASAEAGRATAELADERRARQRAEAQLSTAAADIDRLRAESGSFRSAAERARTQRTALEAELEHVRAELSSTTSALDELTAAAAAAASEPTEPSPPQPPASPVNLEALAAALRDASAAFNQLGQSLATAAAALHDPPAAVDEVPDVTAPASVAPSTLPARQPRPVAPRRRVAARLPPAVFDDSVEAADHLVRLNGVMVLVDGYNVSKLRWPELPIPEQRRRLVDALGGLAARTGADVHVVFDGVEQVEPPLPPERRRMVRVTFSPEDVEADDVLVALVDAVPLHRPVVVVSSDRRVQTGAAQLGANVISSAQLLNVLAR